MSKKTDKPYFYKTLKVLAAENDMTDRDIAKIVGMAYSTYSDKKRGKLRWFDEEMCRICKYFNRSIYGLFWPENLNFAKDNSQTKTA